MEESSLEKLHQLIDFDFDLLCQMAHEEDDPDPRAPYLNFEDMINLGIAVQNDQSKLGKLQSAITSKFEMRKFHKDYYPLLARFRCLVNRNNEILPFINQVSDNYLKPVIAYGVANIELQKDKPDLAFIMILREIAQSEVYSSMRLENDLLKYACSRNDLDLQSSTKTQILYQIDKFNNLYRFDREKYPIAEPDSALVSFVSNAMSILNDETIDPIHLKFFEEMLDKLSDNPLRIVMDIEMMDLYGQLEVNDKREFYYKSVMDSIPKEDRDKQTSMPEFGNYMKIISQIWDRHEMLNEEIINATLDYVMGMVDENGDKRILYSSVYLGQVLKLMIESGRDLEAYDLYNLAQSKTHPNSIPSHRSLVGIYSNALLGANPEYAMHGLEDMKALSDIDKVYALKTVLFLQSKNMTSIDAMEYVCQQLMAQVDATDFSKAQPLSADEKAEANKMLVQAAKILLENKKYKTVFQVYERQKIENRITIMTEILKSRTK